MVLLFRYAYEQIGLLLHNPINLHRPDLIPHLQGQVLQYLVL